MLDLSSKDEGTWFYFSPDNSELGGVCLRELTPDEHRRIETAARKKRGRPKFDPISHTRIPPEVDEEKVSDDRWDYCITDWKEVAIDGEPVKCTRENKIRAMKITAFVKFIVDSLETLVDSNEEFEEARLKNSETSSSGDVEGPGSVPAKSV